MVYKDSEKQKQYMKNLMRKRRIANTNFVVYTIQCKSDSELFYIGSTLDLKRRILDHKMSIIFKLRITI